VQQIPPETSNFYMTVGYAIVVVILVGLVAFFANRARRARAELRLLEELDQEEKAKRGLDK
jgi:nitrate reductase gamma subunit